MKKPLKLAWLTPFLGREGKLLYMKPILSGLSKNFESFCVFTPDAGYEIERVDFIIELAGKLKQLYFKGKGGYHKGVSYISIDFFKKVFEYRPDIIVINEFSIISLYGIILNKIIRNNVVVLLVESKPIKNEQGLLKYIKYIFRKYISNNSNAIITNNIFGYNFLVNDLGVDKKLIVTKPYLVSQVEHGNPIEKVNKWIEKSDCQNEVDFIFVGRLIHQKGLQHAITAFSNIFLEGVENFNFHIIGDGPYLSVLKQLVKSKGLDNKVHFYGSKNHAELSNFYSKAHVFLLPTLRDYRALVPFEALSFGLPLIDSIYNGGSAETVDEGRNGYVIDPENEQQFSEVLMKMMLNKSDLKDFSKRSYEISSKYTLENSVEALLETVELALIN